MAKYKGIDVSTWNGNVDYTKVASAGIDFVIIRAGYGREASQKDDCFERNYKNATAAGLKVGAYWYSYATDENDAKREAQACLKCIKGKKFDYPVFFDLEEGFQINRGKTFCSNLVKAFNAEIENAGYKAGLYCSRYPLTTVITDEVKKKYPLWVAEYGSKLNYTGTYAMWQYTSSGTISGHNCRFDMNYCYVDTWQKGTTSKQSTIKIKKDGYIYKEAYNGSGYIEHAVKGDTVKWIEDDKYGWSKVTFNGKTGWIYNTYLDKSGLSSFPTGKIVKKTALREKRSITSKNKKTVPLNAKITVKSVRPDGWAYCKYDGVSGWCKESKITY